MKTRDFSFDLPAELIAQHPTQRRSESRLLVLNRRSGAVEHRNMGDLPELLPEGGVLVLNDSKVRKARVYGEVGRAERELLFLGAEESDSGQIWSVMAKRPRRLKTGSCITLPNGQDAEVVGHGQQTIRLRVDPPLDEAFFLRHGHVPLPPYIRRDDAEEDESRYQTVYAAEPGSVAAPTAGLHLTRELLSKIEERGTEILHVTLHVGPGTFLPVRSEDVTAHVMHHESYEIGETVAQRLNAAIETGTPVTAVGTTSVRTLESAFDRRTGTVSTGRNTTDLFIYPGYEFGIVSSLMTNFHTPESTLLMLVCAFAGRERVLSAYREAVELRYRFFSYGDAMFIQ